MPALNPFLGIIDEQISGRCKKLLDIKKLIN
jgi:hypothetical protein